MRWMRRSSSTSNGSITCSSASARRRRSRSSWDPPVLWTGRSRWKLKAATLIEGVPKTITVTDEEIREALSDSIAIIINAIKVALERTPPELSADIMDRGIVLTGGGALLKAFRQEAVSGNRASRFRCGESAFIRRPGNKQDADGSEAVPENLCPVN